MEHVLLCCMSNVSLYGDVMTYRGYRSSLAQAAVFVVVVVFLTVFATTMSKTC